jgi:diaminopimelate decarboxylase
MDQRLYREIADEYGTPVYVYDGEMIESQFRELASCLPGPFEIFYSVKSNPLLGICQLLRKLGSRVEVASYSELYTALKAGFDPQDMIFTSPGKTREELEFAIQRNIYSMNVESLEEARLIHEIASARMKRVRIAVRINPSFNVAGASMKMTGVPTQFGIDQTVAGAALEEMLAMPWLEVAGIHIFTGTQMLDANSIATNMEEIMKLAVELSDTHGFRLQFLDLGGGFGVPYFKGDEPLDLELLRGRLAELWSRYEERLRGTRIGVESGRFLLAEAGVFLTKVLYVKECKGTTYLICDGGSHQHASTAFLGRYVRNNFPMYIAGKEKEETREVVVAGPLCTPTDVMGQKVLLPEAEAGDLLVIEKSGAYGLTHSPVLFLSHMLPPEVMHYGGRFYLLRERGRAEDFLRGQSGLQEAAGFRDSYEHNVSAG